MQATSWNASSQSQLPQRSDTTDTGMVISYAGFNLRDQIRKDATLPNQLLYLPADCRIYWTFKNYNNYTRLWQDTWSAIYDDSSLCIGTPSDADGTSDQDRRRSASIFAADESAEPINPYILQGLNPFGEPGVEDYNGYRSYADFPPLCAGSNNKPDQTKCPTKSICRQITNKCGNPCKTVDGFTTCSPKGTLSEWRCVRDCNTGLNDCSSSTTCVPHTADDGSVNAAGARSRQLDGSVQSQTYTGRCLPNWQDPRTTSCKRLRWYWDQYDQQ
jgi:hypothetical protein